jgi:hypothetical protein
MRRASVAIPYEKAQQIYEDGFDGCYPDPDAAARLWQTVRDMGGDPFDAARRYGLSGSGAGKLSLPFLAQLRLYPDSLPGVAQQRGDCVSFSTRTAAVGSYCASLVYGSNEHGYVAPVVSPVARQNGVASTEALYWYRGYDGDGWSCAAAADIAISKSGIVLRQKYPDLGLDLTEYSPTMAGKWGRLSPPEKVQAMTNDNLCRNATNCKTYEEVRDMLANGYCLSTCGSEAFTDKRNAYGICDRTNKTWHHAIAAIAVDDRPETVEREKGGLILLCNSWGDYVGGARAIWNTDKQIPVGSFWARWRDIEDRYFIALGPSVGWPANKLPNWGLENIV